MQIWLDEVRLPVLPPEYTVLSEQSNTAVTVCNLGEINLLGKRNLKQISFSSFFPRRYDKGYCEYHADDPESMVEEIEKLMEQGTVQLTITGTNIDMPVTIESFEWGEKDRTGDISYTLTLKEYRYVSIPSSVLEKEQSDEADTESTERPQPEQTGPQTYTVKKGDCLSTIAKKLTGSSNWRPIYEQNKNVIGSNPNLIKPGQVLTIPGAKT